MTTKYFCDRCNKEINPFTFKDFIKSTYESVNVNQKKIVICKKCYDEFKKWVKMMKSFKVKNKR